MASLISVLNTGPNRTKIIKKMFKGQTTDFERKPTSTPSP